MRGKRGPRPIDKPRPGKKKAEKPTSLAAEVPRQLDDKQLDERKTRLATKYMELKALGRRKKNAVKQINAQLSEVTAECDKLSEEITHGMEMVKQGDLFAPAAEARRAELAAKGNGHGKDDALPKDQAAKTLAKVAEKAGDVPSTTAH